MHAIHASHACALVACASDLAQLANRWLPLAVLLLAARSGICVESSDGFGQRGHVRAQGRSRQPSKFALCVAWVHITFFMGPWHGDVASWLSQRHLGRVCLHAAFTRMQLSTTSLASSSLRYAARLPSIVACFALAIADARCSHRQLHARKERGCVTRPRGLRLIYGGETVLEQLWCAWAAWDSSLWAMTA